LLGFLVPCSQPSACFEASARVKPSKTRGDGPVVRSIKGLASTTMPTLRRRRGILARLTERGVAY
jgi:hypothetical protein